jgi:hypothetical protein
MLIGRAVALAVAVWFAGAATPQSESADALIAHGLELRRDGRDEEALKLFRRAYDLAPSPRSRAQVALAEQALGQWVAADEDMAAALHVSEDPWIARNASALNEALRVVRSHTGQIMILGTPAGANVRINGNVAGRLPLSQPARVAAGDVVVAVDAPGYESISRRVSVAANTLDRETIELPISATPSSRCHQAPAALGFERATDGIAIKNDEFTAFKSWAFTNARSWCSPGALRINASYDLTGKRNAHGRFPNQVGQLVISLGKHVDMTGKTVTAHVYVEAPATASYGAILSVIQNGVLVGGKFIYPLKPGDWNDVAATYTAENRLYEGGTSRVNDVDGVVVQVDALGSSPQRTWSGAVYVDDVDWR